MPPQPETLERETVYSLLADRVREYLLRYLTVVDRTTVSDAAERIAAWCREARADPAGRERDQVAIQLVHIHLPRLVQYDVVNYDRSNDEIVPGRNFEDLEPFVEQLEPPQT